MIRGAALGAFLLALPPAIVAGGCQSTDYSTPAMPSGAMPTQAGAPPTPMDGTWASIDGVFVATFISGNFTSRFTQTNEILAQGTYTVAGPTVNLTWISVASQTQRSAVCTMATSDVVSCTQDDGGSFDLKRAA